MAVMPRARASGGADVGQRCVGLGLTTALTSVRGTGPRGGGRRPTPGQSRQRRAERTESGGVRRTRWTTVGPEGSSNAFQCAWCGSK
jgi:hypothetical protein